ncbi:MAG: hypothetical protein Q8K58_04085 [Acidimicrobiales bacterium]|nr:hypothetical protein [Acidimicrobiales bacterium]
MATLLLPLCLALLWIATHDHRARLGLGGLSARGSLVVAYVLLNAAVLAVCEVASIGHRLTATTVALCWSGLAIALLGGIGRGWAVRRRARALLAGWRASSVLERIVAGVGLAYVVVLATVAALYRPATGDAMTYHLARVEHWIQDRSVAPFATHFLAQIDLSPLSEYSIVQLHLLTGGDRLDGFVQLLAYVVAAAGASEAARLLGGSRLSQVLAPALAMTLPAAVLQATSAQNDLFGAAIGVCVLVLVLAWDTDGPVLPQAGLLGLGAGLAVLAKGTVAPTVGLALVGLALAAARREVQRGDRWAGWGRVGAAAGVAVVAFLLAAGPFVGRNLALFGSPTGADQDDLVVEEITFDSAAANTVRSIASNFRVGNGRSGPEHVVGEAALRLGEDAYELFDIDQDDTRYTLGFDADAFAVRDYRRLQRWSEFSANPWHALLLATSGIALLVAAARRTVDRRTVGLVVGVGLGFVLFASLVRWQVFGNRFQLPGLLAWCPLIALVLARCGRIVSHVVIALLVAASLPMLLDNAERPLLDPTYDDVDAYLEHYVFPWDGKATTAADYDAVSATLAASGCRALGLSTAIGEEYPLWVGLDHHGWEGEIRAVGVRNDSAELMDEDFEPCALLRRQPDDGPLPADGVLQRRFGELVLTLPTPQPIGT